jgi:NAD(P)H-flavin reductase
LVLAAKIPNKINQAVSGLKRYYGDLEMLGKHYTVVSYGESG